MAENIDASIIGLKNSIDALSARIRSTGERRMQSLVSSPSLARVNKLIETSAEIDRIYEQRSKAKDLVRAGRAMRRDPDRWSSHGEYLRWESATRSRRRREFDREQGVIDYVRKIRNPDLQHKYDLEKRYGSTGASQILAAEADATGEESRKAYEWDMLSDSERNFRTLTDKYGGGPEGEARARDVIAKRQRENLARLDMSDYEQFVHDNADAYGGREGADQAYRKMLIKQLPPFFKNSKLSTQSLISIRKAMISAKGIPLVGKLMHPASLGFAALGLAGSYLRASDAANKTVTGWSTARNISGAPTRAFSEVARLAGAKNEQEVLDMYGGLIGKYGTVDAMRSVGGALRSVPKGIARLKFLESQGLSTQQANALMYLAGEKPPKKTKEAQDTAAKLSRLEDVQKHGLRTGASMPEKLRGWSLSIPLEKSLEARGTSWLEMINLANPAMWPDMIFKRVFGSPIDHLDDGIRKQLETEESAESYNDYTSREGDVSNYNSSSSHAMYINEINVATNNPGDFVGGLEKMSDGGTMNNRAVLASFGSGMLA